jgi:hypothetical protein
MSSFDDGGPAFPMSHDPENWKFFDRKESDWKQAALSGMTLRDYFAGKALAVVLGRILDKTTGVTPRDELGRCQLSGAALAYETADAMLSARKAVENPTVALTGQILADLIDACESARRTLDVAIRAGLDGFTESQTDEMVKNHVTMKKLTAAINSAKGGAS